jgi:hypothetical protein
VSVNDRQVGGAHYRSELQHWDLIERHGVGYLEGCATKYVTRWRAKGGILDLEKADHYVEKLMALHQEGMRQPRGAVPWCHVDRFAKANGLDNTEAAVVTILCDRWNREMLQYARTLLRRLREEHERADQST